MKRHLFWLTLAASCLFTGSLRAAELLQLKPGDRVCLIGNTFADRMQHSGWLESLIYSRFPQDKLVFRNLGFSGDELKVRQRSEGFGSPDDWLKKEQADVVFAFFGYNESFQGLDGLPQFRKDLDEFIKHTLTQNYSGRGNARLVLFSPVAAENHPDLDFPRAASRNGNLQLYTFAMAEVAKANDVPFVDLFTPSQKLYAAAKEPLTINGVHFTADGYRQLAPIMFEALFGEAPPRATDADSFDALRKAVCEKNAVWFSRYRTIDGYNVYGGRSYMKYNGVMNRDTMQREMQMRDVMTANRDEKVWAVAQGKDFKVVDDNLPSPVKVTSNKPGPNPDGSYSFLSGEEAIGHMKVPPGCKVNLFASEEQFPELANPVQMAFDTKGRLWVAAWPNYPERTPESTSGDRLLVFEDTDGDGRADKCTTFVDDLNAPTGFQFYKDGVILVQAPDIWFLRDTDGDGHADWRRRLIDGIDSADSHHTANSLVLDPGGAIYTSDGVFHRTQVETPWGPPVRNLDACIYRFEPRTSKFERYVPYDFANPHGRVFDYWGNDLITDATGNNTYFGPAFSGHLDYPTKHPGMKEFWDRPSRPCPGTGMLYSRHFPDEFQGNFLNCNVIGFQGIFRVKVTEEGSGLHGETIASPLVVSDDPNFRPTGVDVAPDGSIYFLDWHNPIIGHLQHHLRDPSRDHTHGRIYRITYPSRPLLQPAQIAGASVENLLDLLKEPEDNVRTRAKIELGKHDPQEVMTVLQSWVKQFDAQRREDQHHLLEALWVCQWMNVVDEPLLHQMLHSPEPRARAQAVRVLGYWRDRVSQPLTLLREAANDPAPRVRLEAVRVASFFSGREALEVAHEILKYDTDYYLDYTFNETLRQLEHGSKEVFLPSDPKALARTVTRLSDAQIKEAPAVNAILVERLQRKNMDLNTRSMALEQLSTALRSNRAQEALAALERLDANGGSVPAFADLGTLLAANSPEDLNRIRPDLNRLSQSARDALVQEAADAALVVADGKPDALWTASSSNPAAQAKLADSIGLLMDPSFRGKFEPLLTNAIADHQTDPTVREASLRALPLLGPDHAAKSFEILATHLRDRQDLTTAARAVTQLPRSAWDKKQAEPVATSILAWAKTIPADRRADQDFVETLQVGTEMAELLPPGRSAELQKEFRSLSVQVFVVKSVREQMRYDTTQLVVQAGKPFQIIFENVDMMAHNLVIVEPGAREEVGLEAQKMPPTLDHQGRAYIPRNKKILAGTRLVEPGHKEVLKLTAPTKPGHYDYLCTYPEHWKVMFGELVVVQDPTSYLSARADSGSEQAAQTQAAHMHHH